MAAPATSADGLIGPAAPAPAAYAGLVSRGIALAIDSALVQGALLVGAALLALVAALVGGISLGPVETGLTAAAWLLLTAGYFVTCWSTAGQTLGMQAMHLRVTTTAGDTISPSRACVRVLWLGLCIIPLFAGFIPVLFDERRRGVHDMIARTVVTHTDAPPSATP